MKRIIIVLSMLFVLATVCNSATIYYCPKCGGEEIEIICTDPVPEDKKVSMDEYPNISIRTTLEMRYSHFRLTCKLCGYSVETRFPH